MALPDHGPFAAMDEQRFSAHFETLVRLHGLIDDAFYRAATARPDLSDPVAHYVVVGGRAGARPNPRFDGDFLAPYYAAAGLSEPPAYIWLALAGAGGALPANQAEAEHLAAPLRASVLFDTAYYRRRLPQGLDPALHYAVIGEALGWRPSPAFDPDYYVERYPDIAQSGLSPLLHYERHGRFEGRRAVSAADRLELSPLRGTAARAVLVMCHEASRTGAPVLGWNLVRGLGSLAPTVALLLRGGDLEADFRSTASATIGPMTWEDWHPADARRVIARLVATYDFAYAVANSIETQAFVPDLVRAGIPVVALVHEFAAYTRPLAKMRNVFDWASHVVFPAKLSAQSSCDAFPGLDQRPGLHVLPQGRNDPPPRQATPGSAPEVAWIDAAATGDVFLVVGLGAVQLRKGVDLFIAAAAAARRLRPDIPFRFLWVGDGYDPAADSAYSVYLAYQIANSELGDSFRIVDAVDDLRPVYAAADALLLSSRLDPQPNVAIDAICRGIPTVCFRNASGTAEILAADAATARLVAAHGDAHAAAQILCDLADDDSATATLREAVARVGRAAFDMDGYVGQIHRWGRDAAASMTRADWQTLLDSGIVDPDMALPPRTPQLEPGAAEWQVIAQWSVMGLSRDPSANPQFRRPCAGFNPQVYAQARPGACPPGGANPLADWLRAGRPVGPWLREVVIPGDAGGAPADQLPATALHAHLYYAELADDLRTRLAANKTVCDLFLTTDTAKKARHLRSVFARHGARVEVAVVPNRGRDLAPFILEALPWARAAGHEVLGHVHGKRSLGIDAAMGESWRYFLFEHLIGGPATLDLAREAFAADARLGLLMAEDPHLVGWNANRDHADALAARMGIDDLPDHFDFPVGTMFWARTEPLAPLLALGLGWDDFPDEPVGNDGTVLHAIERLVPFITAHAGFGVKGVHVPGVSW